MKSKEYLQRSARQRRQQYSRASDPGVRMTAEGIEEFLDICRKEGRVKGTIERYRCNLKLLYKDLPEDKTIRHGTLEHWREDLVQRGYASSTINNFLSAGNSYLDFAGHREYQLIGQVKAGDNLQPELTRTEYLHLLRSARALGKEKVYLLIKLFGSTSLTVQELPKVTVEAVQAGKVTVFFSHVKSVVYIPEHLRKELLSYAKRNGYLSGPIFLTRNGVPLNRTYVSASIRQLCTAAQVAEEKGNPRCLKRLYQDTRAGIEGNISLLAERAYERLLEREQGEIGWGER